MVPQIGAGKNSHSPLYSETIKCKKLFDEKHGKITKNLMFIKVTQVLI